MDLVIRLFVVFQIFALVISTTRLIIDVSNCDGPQKTVNDDARNKQNLTSHCYCEIKSNFTGELILSSKNICSPVLNVFDNNDIFIKTICDHKPAHFIGNVIKGDKLKLVLLNNYSFQSGNPEEIVQIYAKENPRSGLFSVTCGSASALTSIGSTTIPTLVTGTFEASNKGTFKRLPTRFAINNVTSVTEPDAFGPNINASNAEFSYRYVVAAGSIVIVVALIIYIRRKTRARNTSKEETNEARTYDKATNGTERAENVDSTEQQLPYNPLFQLYQINDDGGYSFCRIENIGHTEQLPNDTLYHFFEGNDETIDSKNETDRAGTLPSTKNTMLCTHDLLD
uniref:Uncharacterized protein LOC111105508 n=1 Tax=Crassostrea virginica TaxID=6565 RepID=A0A8B8AXT8_CRAVI|nr:uncharacterized protein LOC111105508 [Crassostrea virginica]